MIAASRGNPTRAFHPPFANFHFRSGFPLLVYCEEVHVVSCQRSDDCRIRRHLPQQQSISSRSRADPWLYRNVACKVVVPSVGWHVSQGHAVAIEVVPCDECPRPVGDDGIDSPEQRQLPKDKARVPVVFSHIEDPVFSHALFDIDVALGHLVLLRALSAQPSSIHGSNLRSMSGLFSHIYTSPRLRNLCSVHGIPLVAANFSKDSRKMRKTGLRA